MSIRCKAKRCSNQVDLFLTTFQLPGGLRMAATANRNNAASADFFRVIVTRLKPVAENKTGHTIANLPLHCLGKISALGLGGNVTKKIASLLSHPLSRSHKKGKWRRNKIDSSNNISHNII